MKDRYKIYSQSLAHWYEPEDIFVSLFGKEAYAFWLDSSKVAEGLSRFSYMGVGSTKIQYAIAKKHVSIQEKGKETIREESMFTYLERELKKWQQYTPCTLEYDKLPFDFTGGFVGYFGYEMYKETIPQEDYLLRSVVHQNEKEAIPDAYFFFVDRFLAFDHKEKKAFLICIANSKQEAKEWFEEVESRIKKNPPSPFPKRGVPQDGECTFSRNHKQYLQDITTCQEYVRKGESYQICLTNQATIKKKVDWLQLYLMLRQTNPAPYSAYFRFGNCAVLSSSPELFLKIDKNRTITSKPMKGTVKRGKTEKEDRKLAENLGKTEKEYAENIMIVDLIRNDLGKVSEIGSVHVPKFLSVETYATVHQLVSTITGKLRKNVSVIDAIKAAFPGGSMTGAPKLRAMKIIHTLEKEPRGIYSGALGFLSLNGTMEVSIIIRTIIATHKTLSFGSGGAILLQSDPESEYNEMLLKGKALRKAISLCI